MCLPGGNHISSLLLVYFNTERETPPLPSMFGEMILCTVSNLTPDLIKNENYLNCVD